MDQQTDRFHLPISVACCINAGLLNYPNILAEAKCGLGKYPIYLSKRKGCGGSTDYQHGMERRGMLVTAVGALGTGGIVTE